MEITHSHSCYNNNTNLSINVKEVLIYNYRFNSEVNVSSFEAIFKSGKEDCSSNIIGKWNIKYKNK